MVDIVGDILKQLQELQPDSTFIKSLYIQYMERGGLSKKQLEGLYSKASKHPEIPAGKLATLEAIILRKHAKHRSAIPPPTTQPLPGNNEEISRKLEMILAKYPDHKRVNYFKLKNSKEGLNKAELDELEKFMKWLGST